MIDLLIFFVFMSRCSFEKVIVDVTKRTTRSRFPPYSFRNILVSKTPSVLYNQCLFSQTLRKFNTMYTIKKGCFILPPCSRNAG